ncbi:MAG TPA: hypothetical protein VHJ82_00035 [Actinomycetota bacterium]|nr:hypothetical protein [Actinomycetota bacterium]
MAVADRAVADRLGPILEEVARAVGNHGISAGNATGNKAVLRIEMEENVRRVVQVYWTPFQANVPGRSVGLHLEVAEPRVHWAECYLSPSYRNWFFAFHERADGEIQLAYYQDFATPSEAIQAFFENSAWYVLAATGTKWSDVVYQPAADVPWPEYLSTVASGSTTAAAVQESLKKSTIIWLRWKADGREQTMPVWFVMDQVKIYVLSGERQQTIPDATDLRNVDVIVRWKGKNARVAEIPALVRVLEPGPEWDQIAEKIAEKRLNIPGLPEETARRWRDECVILELTLQA